MPANRLEEVEILNVTVLSLAGIPRFGTCPSLPLYFSFPYNKPCFYLYVPFPQFLYPISCAIRHKLTEVNMDQQTGHDKNPGTLQEEIAQDPTEQANVDEKGVKAEKYAYYSLFAANNGIGPYQ